MAGQKPEARSEKTGAAGASVAAPGEPGPALSLDAFLCFSVYSTGHAFNQLYRPLLDAVGLTYAQYLVMVALWRREDLTVKELGRQLFLESSTLTPLLKRLERQGFVTRLRDAEDERQVRIGLTTEGRALREAAAGIPGCVAAATGMDVDELARLQRDIGRLRDGILARAEG